ncbi:MAG: hypothetical protein ACI4WX_14250 [Aristaeellaceae bacterium]
MKIQISDNLIRHYLRNVYFINGHSYAGKSTMVRMLAERCNMIHCGENYHDAFPREKLDRWKQPGLCYFDTMSGWPEWLSQTPEEHYRWTSQVTQECIEIEILELMRLAAGGQKIIVDTNIPPEVLREISDYDHVAIMLCDPPDITAQKFFDRDDPDKQFMLSEIRKCPDPEATLKNFSAWALYHPPLETDWQHTGFFTLTRSDFENDTREEMLAALRKHFKL